MNTSRLVHGLGFSLNQAKPSSFIVTKTRQAGCNYKCHKATVFHVKTATIKRHVKTTPANNRPCIINEQRKLQQACYQCGQFCIVNDTVEQARTEIHSPNDRLNKNNAHSTTGKHYNVVKFIFNLLRCRGQLTSKIILINQITKT